MNAPFKALLQSDSDAFHLRRSRCLDAFAEIEEAIVGVLNLLDFKLANDSLGQKLETLKSAKASPTFSRERLARLQALLPICEALNTQRNDIVHSRMQIALIGHETKACFANIRQSTPGSQIARLLSLDGFDELHRTIRQTAALLRQIQVNPASSPPPP